MAFSKSLKVIFFLGILKNSWRNYDKPHSVHLHQGKGETDRRTGEGEKKEEGREEREVWEGRR